jgi:hypothetical protein
VPLGVKLLQAGVGSLRGAIGSPKQIADLCKRYEAAGVDQITFVLQAGNNRHEHICESLELFGREVIPRFMETREAKERAKAERLAPAISRALARRAPPRSAEAYLVDEVAEVSRSRHSRPKSLKNAIRDRTRDAMGGYLRGKPEAFLARTFERPLVQRAIFGAMANAFVPEKAFGFEGAIVYELGGGNGTPPDRWTLHIGKTKARALRGDDDKPAVRVRIGHADFARLLSGEAHPVSLAMAGRIVADGDLSLMARLGEMFGGPSTY